MYYARSLLAAIVLLAATPAVYACGTVSITEMNWSSGQIVTAVAKFLMERGYGCTVTKVPSATVTSVASLAENNEPDIVTELWFNSAGDAYKRLEAEGKAVRLAEVLTPGGIEGWWIPKYVADAHPEIKTVADIMANPDVVGRRFHNCPVGWGCRNINDNLIRALDLEAAGIEIFNHGSGETLDASIAAAYTDQGPWFGYQSSPHAVFGKYPLVRVTIGATDIEVHEANQNKDNPDPRVSDYPPATVLTVTTPAFAQREPEVAELMRHVQFDIDAMNALLGWQEENGATAQEAAARFLSTESAIWSAWLNDSAREKLAALIR